MQQLWNGSRGLPPKFPIRSSLLASIIVGAGVCVVRSVSSRAPMALLTSFERDVPACIAAIRSSGSAMSVLTAAVITDLGRVLGQIGKLAGANGLAHFLRARRPGMYRGDTLERIGDVGPHCGGHHRDGVSLRLPLGGVLARVDRHQRRERRLDRLA